MSAPHGFDGFNDPPPLTGSLELLQAAMKERRRGIGVSSPKAPPLIAAPRCLLHTGAYCTEPDVCLSSMQCAARVRVTQQLRGAKRSPLLLNPLRSGRR